MINVILNEEIVCNEKNYDSALRTCANLYKKGHNIEDMKIIRDNGLELPVQIKHLIISLL